MKRISAELMEMIWILVSALHIVHLICIVSKIRILDISYKNRKCCLDYVPKTTYAHLTPYSIMDVQPAAEVFSSTVSNVLLHYALTDVAETSNIYSKIDIFFNIMNIWDIYLIWNHHLFFFSLVNCRLEPWMSMYFCDILKTGLLPSS